MRRELTEEQKQAHEARRAKFRKLAKDLSALPKHQREAMAARMPAIATVEGRTLSAINTCLVAAQFPAATLVGGFRQWKKAGRVVRKGEHGISLWCPMLKKQDENAQPGEVTADDSLRFIMGCVFDVSQTEELTAAAPAVAPAEELEQVAA